MLLTLILLLMIIINDIIVHTSTQDGNVKMKIPNLHHVAIKGILIL